MDTIKTIFIYLFLFLFACPVVFSQKTATTEDGQKVILQEDGTWMYADEQQQAEGLSCEDLISIETDKMTGKSVIGAKKLLKVLKDEENQNGFAIFVHKGKRSIIFSIKVLGASNCIQDDSRILILFRDGERMELTNEGGANCEANFTLMFEGPAGKKRELRKFGSKEVESFRIWTARGFVENDFSPIQSLHFMKIVSCLTDKL
ncbi:MAG: hypothetical protein U5Q03_04410 [Bacteroidota bacterium]|nr:hypothetical protein [Bacteroidota bacterium]